MRAKIPRPIWLSNPSPDRCSPRRRRRSAGKGGRTRGRSGRSLSRRYARRPRPARIAARIPRARNPASRSRPRRSSSCIPRGSPRCTRSHGISRRNPTPCSGRRRRRPRRNRRCSRHPHMSPRSSPRTRIEPSSPRPRSSDRIRPCHGIAWCSPPRGSRSRRLPPGRRRARSGCIRSGRASGPHPSRRRRPHRAGGRPSRRSSIRRGRRSASSIPRGRRGR